MSEGYEKIKKVITDWTSKAKTHYPNDDDVAEFVREVIPYLDSLEARISALEKRKS